MATGNPYQAPNADVVNASNDTYTPRIFTPQGRIGRLRYLAYGMLSYLLVIPVFLVVGVLAAAGASDDGGVGILGGIGMLIGAIAYIAIIVYSFMLSKRRFNDLGQSGWLSLLFIIPLVNIIVGLFLIFAPGKPMTNQYGQPPGKNPIWVIICALVYPIAIIGILAAIVVPAYSDYVERAQQAESIYTEPVQE